VRIAWYGEEKAEEDVEEEEECMFELGGDFLFALVL
jgi:hypothetical protein